MRRPLTWFFVGFLGAGAGLTMPGCSDDDQAPANGGGGASSNGTGGSSTSSSTPSSTTTASSTSTGSGGGTVTTGLGQECGSDRDCTTGLTCRRSDRNSLVEGGPAHGLCTLACGTSEDVAANDADCEAFDPNSLCVQFSDDAAYCLQRCSFGSADKCSGRAGGAGSDFVCDQIIHGTDGTECTDSRQCDIGDGCYDVGGGEGLCFDQPTVCKPQCNANLDCPVGRFCDVGSGLCVDDEPTGKRFGEPCDPDADVDECVGSCSPTYGVCLELCTLGAYPSCNSESLTDGTGACLLRALEDADSAGDIGLCGKLCDCTDDCFGDLVCTAFEDSQGPFSFAGRDGICVAPGGGGVVLNECPLGAGGAGGQGGAGSE